MEYDQVLWRSIEVSVGTLNSVRDYALRLIRGYWLGRCPSKSNVSLDLVLTMAGSSGVGNPQNFGQLHFTYLTTPHPSPISSVSSPGFWFQLRRRNWMRKEGTLLFDDHGVSAGLIAPR